MSLMDYFRLFVLCLGLLDRDVNAQKGYVPRVQAGQAPAGVHSDDGIYKRWSEPPIFRILAAGYETSGRVHPAREDHTTDAKPSHIQSYPASPEIQNKNVPVNPLQSGLGSAARRRSSVVYNRSGNKAFPFPDGKKMHQRNSNSAFSAGAVQVPPSIYRTRSKLTGGFSPVQVHRAAVGFANRKPHKIHAGGYQPAYAFPKSFNPDRANMLQALKPTDKKTDAILRGQPPASSSAGQADTQMSYPLWSPRVYNGDVTSEARGYAHTRRIKPVSEKQQPQGSSAAGRKFLESGFPSVIQNQGGDSTKAGFGPNHNSRRSQPSSRHPPAPDRAQVPVQGKFKPFERLPAHDDLPARNRSDHETAPTQTSAGTTPPPSLNSTGITSSVVPSATGELSTESASPPQTEGQDVELEPQPSNHEGQSETPGVAPFLQQNKPVTVSPPTVLPLEPAEEEGKDGRVVSSPPEEDPAEV